MSEQKYYIKFNKDVIHLFSGLFTPINVRRVMTLPEIAKSSQEILARYCAFDDLTEINLVGKVVDGYWINPIIELVPVKEE